MVFARLSVMMFLQFFVWGAWYVTLGTYLVSQQDGDMARIFSDAFVGDAYGTDAIAAMIAPLFIGLVAERFLASEKVLGILHLGGAVALYLVSTTVSPGLFYLGLLVHFMCYMPTLSLSTSLSFENMEKPDVMFPYVRVFGTAGWIIAGVLVSLIKLNEGSFVLTFNAEAGSSIEPTAIPMLIAAVAQFVLGIYCFTLPHTPPKVSEESASLSQMLGLDALSIFKRPGVIVFVISAVLLCVPLKFYYTWSNAFLNSIGVDNAAAKMSLGQMSEVVFMILLPMGLIYLGTRWVLAVGMFCWILRYVLFAYGDAGDNMWMLYIGILLHGVCYDFFFVAGQMYMDKNAPVNRRASVQCLLTFLTLGVGMFIGSIISGRIVSAYTTPGEGDVLVRDWTSIWLFPAGLAAIVAIFFLITFRNSKEVSTDPIADTDSV